MSSPAALPTGSSASSSSTPLSQSQPKPKYSSAAFLHHLHNDPSSHHVSLTAPSVRQPSLPSERGADEPAPDSRLFSEDNAPGSSALDRPMLPTRRSSAGTARTIAKAASTPGFVDSPLALPATTAISTLRRAGSKRGRPMTAPGGSPGEPFLPSTSSIEGSPDHRTVDRMEDPPYIPAQDDYDYILDSRPEDDLGSSDEESGGMDACGISDVDGTGQALEMMSISGKRRRRRGPTRVVGRADDSSERRPEETLRNTDPHVRVTQEPSRLQSDPSPSKPPPRMSPPDLDWRTFGKAYAYGNFDPNKTPQPPATVLSPQSRIPTARWSPGEGYRPSSASALLHDTDTSSSRASGSTGPFSQASGSSDSNTTFASAGSAPLVPSGATIGKTQSSTSVPTQGGMAGALAGRGRAFELETLANRKAGTSSGLRPNQLELPSYSLAAATVRMASSHIPYSGLAPLGIPSPDRELLDPMASMFSPSSSSTLRDNASSDPGGSRFTLSRSMSTAAVPRDRAGHHLPTIAASPAGTPLEHPAHGKGKGIELPRRATSPPPSLSRILGPGGIVNQRIPPATAPVEKVIEAESEEDYFGAAAAPNYERNQSYRSQSSSNQTVTQTATPAVRSRTPEGVSSQPVADEPKVSPPPAFAQPGELGALYEKYGWLPAPVPPDEAARRKALYRFNILHTSPDVNFDRIAHMAKLVFSTKIVIIGLTDAETQWHKTETGLGATEASRFSSFCSHTLLLKTDEPLVVLDAQQDWRFANNPNVTSAPHIRFYAGAPLRTSDGHNLGTLCIIDDKPRAEFPPRSRLILKEFAAVCMREMELWRDKLQLRVRDRIQTSMERFTRECLEMDAKSSASSGEASTKMDKVYARAAELVCTTLDLDGCFILDVGHFELVDVETPEGKKSVYRADPYTGGEQEDVLEVNQAFGPTSALPVLGASPAALPTRSLTAEEHQKMSDFLLYNRDGRIFENVAPSWIRYMFPSELRYGMVVPCFGVYQQPFALIVGYTCNKAKQYLEGYELQFLRAIGVIILSAVLRRRMVLADKTKSILISSVSHELRTPLHGILAAAELLSDTELDSNQSAFLKTVQTCGNTLIETVNHVLDFTKLSGSVGTSKDASIKLAKVNLANLVEQTVEGVWIGQRARFMGDSDVGSFYAPPSSALQDRAARMAKDTTHVETVVDVGHRDKGWMVRCERGGLRRVLMNLVGNSLKFTKDGYIQVTLRELPHPPGSKTIPVEMAVIDTGKGIGKEFLKDQLFHPFSQENPLQTGTGLGLAIVNSIIRSDSVNGKVDVWSSEGLGTEIRISFEVEVYDEEEDSSSSSSSAISSASSGFGRGHSVSMSGFDTKHRGQVLALEVLATYASTWSFDLRDDGDIIIINEDEELFRSASQAGRPIVFVTSTQTPSLMHLRDSIKRSGNFVQVIHKPVAPTPFRGALQAAVAWLDRQEDGGSTPISEMDRPSLPRGESNESASTISDLHHRDFLRHSSSGPSTGRQPLYRRRSEEQDVSAHVPPRPSMAPRGITYHTAPVRPPPPTSYRSASISGDTDSDSPQPGSPTSSTSHISHISTISLAGGGVMLKAAQLAPSAPRPDGKARVLVVEDNVINRRVLGAFLKKKGCEYAEAFDGRDGVDLFDSTPYNHWDIILMDISMPNMNGHQATRAIRKIEASRRMGRPAETPLVPEAGQPILLPSPRVVQSRAKIFALTGLATAEDKREAFGSGVDGYLVKPVSLASLDVVFKKLGY